MRKHSIIAVFYALSIFGVASIPTTSQAEIITVFHGQKAEIFNTAKSPANGIYVEKPIRKASPKVLPVVTNTRSQPRAVKRTFVAGNTLWARNARTGKLIACFVGSSGKVGRSVIRCTGPGRFGR